MKIKSIGNVLRTQPTAPPVRSSGLPVLVPCRVLVVDDNTDLAEATSRLLRLFGFLVETAKNGCTAVELTRAFRPFIVLMDINLPDMDGYEVARNLRKDHGMDQAILIAMSAVEPRINSPFDREARFDHYLMKPFDLELLLCILTESTH